MKENVAFDKIKEKFKGDKRLAIIVVIGIVGIILLVLSELIPTADEKEKTNTNTNNNSQQSTYENYEEETEDRLAQLISSINGAGNTKVMLTLDSGDENVYAVEENSSNSKDTTSSERKYVIVDNNSDDSGLLLKVVQPEVRGVAVVCEGADSASVQEEIISTVTAVLGISSSRVSIAKMKKE